MKMSVSIILPLIPLYKTSLPCLLNPTVSNSLKTASLSKSIKIVPSPKDPFIQHNLAKTHSTICPIVIREGKACEFIIISGLIPSFVKGISHSLNILPITPFCPCLEECLSPNSGFLIFNILTLHIFPPSSVTLLLTYILSTIP